MQTLTQSQETTQPTLYNLECQGCGQSWPQPRLYHVAKVIAWAHQRKLADSGHIHAILFVPTRGN